MIAYNAHEAAYRPEINNINGLITICGAGAIGSHIVDNLSRMFKANLRVIDNDVVDIHNVGTQIYNHYDHGKSKIGALKHIVFLNNKMEIHGIKSYLDKSNVHKLLRGSSVVVDALDNHDSRYLVFGYCQIYDIPCVHAGMNIDYAAVRWNERYRPPEDVDDMDVCEYPLARSLVTMTAAITTEAIVRFLLTGEKIERMITMGDLKLWEIPS